MLKRGRYRARLAETAADVASAQALRHQCFILGAGRPARPDGREADAFDARCQHVLVEDRNSGRLVCCFRLLPLTGGAEIGASYSAQFYDLSGLEGFRGPMVEMGRFCIAPDVQDADVLRVAWGAMTAYVDSHGVEMLFGCSSFAGTVTEDYLDAFDLLAERHLAPRRWVPRVKAAKVFSFAGRLGRGVDRRAALRRMPPLLKTYLSMGGWVSDHAVVDDELNTLHVFTGLEIGAIPPARARALRAVAG